MRVNLQQQREEQERLYAEQMRKLDAVLEQQIKAKQAAAGCVALRQAHGALYSHTAAVQQAAY